MRTGLGALENAIEQSSKSGGGYSGRLGYFNLKADESIVVRFLTDVDDIITVDFYEFIMDNKGKPQNFVVATDLKGDPNATDYVLQYGGMQKDYGGSELVTPVPKTRTVALAVVREESVTDGPNGKPVVGYKDAWSEVETKDGKKFEARNFIIVKQAYKNFWAPLVSFYHEYGTLCDRDYKIKRIGKGTDTTYSIIPKKEDQGWDGPASYAALQENYGYGKEPDPESDERFAYCPQTLTQWAESSCSEERVKYFLGDAADRDSAGTTSTPATPRESLVAPDDTPAPAPAAAAAGGSLQERLARHKA